MFEKYTLDNGVRILTEDMPGLKSVSIGLWITTGSCYESSEEAGISHIIEHMLFKGTSRKNALQIAYAFNSLGANVNAFTSHEFICLHSKSLDETFIKTFFLLSECLLDSQYHPVELEREKNVILEEIKLYEDTPDELIIDKFTSTLWGTHPLGRSIIGTNETIQKTNRQNLLSYVRKNFVANNLIISFAGNINRKRILSVVERIFCEINPGNLSYSLTRPKTNIAYENFQRDLESVHFCLGTSAPKKTSKDRFAFSLFGLIYGGGMGSRLYEQIREKRGLSYSIQSFIIPYNNIGCFGVTGGTSPNNLPEVVEIALKELKKMCSQKVSEKELRIAKYQVKSSIMLMLENSNNIMSRNSENEIYFKRYVPIDEVIKNVDAITEDDIIETANKYFHGRKLSLTTIGNGDYKNLFNSVCEI
jgi:predicted Zn-dependent peptidase